MLQLLESPDIEPITLAEAKQHCRVDIDDDDAYLTQLIRVAREYVENYTRRALITQKWQLQLARWPAEIEIIKGPVQQITAVNYRDGQGVLRTLPAGQYYCPVINGVARLRVRAGYAWPESYLGDLDSITVEFLAGYGPAADDVPVGLCHAILLLVAELYEKRTPTGGVFDVPTSVHALMSQHRMPL